MHSVLAFLTIIVTVLALDPQEIFQKCHKVVMSKHCCKSHEHVPTPEDKAVMDECIKPPTRPPTCEMDICMATKKGFSTGEGNIDKAKALEALEKYIVHEPKILEDVKKFCLGDELDNFGMPDMCEATKFRHCVELQGMKSCSEWSNEGVCSGIDEEVKKCSKLFE